MSKAIFFSLPAYGHVNPSLPLATEMIKRGEQVIYYSGNEFKTQIENTGAQFRSYGEKLEQLRAELDGKQGNLIFLSACFLQMCQSIVPEALNQLQEDQPDYLIYDSMAIWGKIIAQKTGLPSICSITSFAIGDGLPDPQILISLIKGLAHMKRFNTLSQQLATALQLAPIGLRDIFVGNADLNIVYTSESFQPNSQYLKGNYKFIGPSIANRNEAVDINFGSNKRIIYISLGTIFNDNLAFYNECFKAFGNTNDQVVLSVGKKINIDALQNIPSNFIVRQYVNQLEILQKASLFITHGGMNSVSESLYFGVPLIVIPMSADQPAIAKRVNALGAGLYLEKRRANWKNLKQSANLVLADESFKKNSMAIGDSFRASGGFKRGVDEIIAYKLRRMGNASLLHV